MNVGSPGANFGVVVGCCQQTKKITDQKKTQAEENVDGEEDEDENTNA